MAEALGLVSSIIAVVDLFIKVGVQCSIYCSGVKNAPRDIRYILNEADRTTSTLEELKRLLVSPNGAKLSSTQNLVQSVAEARLHLQDLAFKLERGLSTGTKARLQKLTWPLKKEEVAAIIGQLQKCRAAIALDLQVDQTALLLNVHQEAILAKLKSAKGAAFDSPSHADSSKCYPGTRQDVLEQIQTWSNSTESQCIFWLNGAAGTGKSTISRTIAQSFSDKGMLGASFFFKHGEAERGNMTLLFPTIASQLAQTFPQVAPHVRAAVEADPTIHDRSIKEQFDKLIADPIKLASEVSQRSTKVVVADALDECDNDEHVRLFIHLLSQTKHSTSVCLKFFVTSRPELAIRLGFSDICGQYEDLILHEVPRVAIEHDIALFLEHETAMIRQDYNKSVSLNRQLPLTWPCKEAFQQLVSMSVPLFIFAATACRFIKDRRIGGPKEQLAKILEQQTGHGTRSNLGATYFPIVFGLVAGLSDIEKRFVSERFNRIVGSIVTLASPLSRPSLARLLKLPLDDIEDQLDLLHSVLYLPPDPRKPVRLYHKSFRDFLVDPTRNDAESTSLWVDERKAHQALATCCLELLLEKGTLKRNMCGLKLPSSPRSEVDQLTLETALPSEVQYACLYWGLHWNESMAKLEDGGLVDRFLNTHLLYWLEALGLIGRITESAEMVNKLLSLVHPENGVSISLLLRDIRRIILGNRASIDISPLQIYYSAIVFAPEESVVKTRFQSELPAWLTVSGPTASKWDACLQTLEGHRNGVSSVAFSHDSKVLASASWGGTAKIWNTVTGACILTIDESGGRGMRSIGFAHDSYILASAAVNDVKLWNAVTGSCISILKGHSKTVNSIALSHDSRILASASVDCTIRLWDAIHGICTSTLKGHSDVVVLVAFSEDSRTLVSASDDDSVKLWDTTTGECKATIGVGNDDDNLRFFRLAALSHDGRILAIIHQRCACIRLINTANGECMATLKGHSDETYQACFSYDARMFASASGTEIRLWDVVTSTSIATFNGHSGPVDNLAFSRDSKLLASVSDDNTVKIWDLEINVDGTPLSATNGGFVFFQSVKLVKGTKTLIAPLSDTIQLWDLSSASQTATLTAGSDWPCSIAVAPNSELLASTSSLNGQMQLWNIATGAHITTIEAHSSSLFSAPDDYVADSMPPSMYEQNGHRHIKICRDIADRGVFSYIANDYSVVSAIAFSHDSQLLASASAVDGIIKVWDVASGACKATLTGHSSWINYLTFLPRSDVLVSSSGDYSVRIWDLHTATCTAKLEGQPSPRFCPIAVSPHFCPISVSPDHKLLATGLDGETIKICDISTGDCKVILRALNRTYKYAFSHDNALLASIAAWPGSNDKKWHERPCALEFWNVSTCLCIARVEISPIIQEDLISFDEVGPSLFTNAGKYILSETVPTERPVGDSLSLSANDVCIRRRGIGLSWDSEWVLWDDDRMIWLPPAHRPRVVHVVESTLALGYSQPQPHMVFLTISPDLVHLEYGKTTDI